MAGDCNYKMHYVNDDTFSPSKPLLDQARVPTGEPDAPSVLQGRGSIYCSPNFDMIDGLLYRKKLERGFIHYREVLDEDRRLGAIATFHRRRPGMCHHSLEDTYRSVAENYWWEGMYFQIRDFVRGCPACLEQRNKRPKKRVGERRLSQTMMSHSRDMLSKLRSQREAGLFCDITLRTDGCSYSAHKAVLAAVSEYFQEVFTEMDSAPSSRSDIDLTGFSESILMSLLDFSYSSILCVSEEDLPEVSTMARHLGMWPAVEACSALQTEQGYHAAQYPTMEHPALGFSSQIPGSPLELHHHQRNRRKNRGLAGEGRERVAGGRRVSGVDDGFRQILDQTNESREESPTRRSPRRPPGPSPLPLGQNGLPLSPTRRMKLMDFKSPSCKISSPPKNVSSNPRSRNTQSSSSSSHTRLLRSTPGAAQEVQRLLPRTESPPRGRKPHPVPHPASNSSSTQRAGSEAPIVRVKQEEEGDEDEEDHFRALEKYRLMSVLGLQRTSLLPRPEDLIGWRQKKRLRKLKVNNYSLTKRRKPRLQASGGLTFGGPPLSLPLCTPAKAHFLSRIIKTEPEYPISMERLKKPRQPRRFPPSDRSMRSKVVLPDLLQPVSRLVYGGRDLRSSVRGVEASHPPPPLPPCSGNTRVPNPKRNISTVRIKPEPADYAISAPSIPSDGQRPNPHLSPPRAHLRHKVTTETVRALRYNSGRPMAKDKLKRSGMKEAGRAQRKPREESMRTGSSQGVRRIMERGPGGLSSRETSSILSPDPVPPPIHSHPLYRVIKEEPADPLPVAGSFPEAPSLSSSPELGKRQIKPPVKLLDPGFLFSFCRPAGGPMLGVKREEESVDICLTRSVSRVERLGSGGAPARVLRARGGPPTLHRVKKEREERSVSQSPIQRQGPPRAVNSHQHKPPHLDRATGSKGACVARDIPKKPAKPLPSRGPALLDSIRRARLKQLRGPRSQAPKDKSSHVCLQCRASCKDCNALIMHRIRHIVGKHWPCPLCNKTFFRMRNVKNHIRTHDQRLYKCRSCLAAS
uniref:serine/arginine repetitive matrix protein 1-like n=1 Tax=Oncorhynchus gorbuscha TaxID=8017 RepID=UPI001EAEAA46|nr:serine/arginine repetitive matrix protein 1-like [Oncorhynchus gorbuscha]